ncbi:hypothetical protein VIGAN_05178800 [Vigna angularis var. angularis]|uniref:Uncharacterized protein n=1 Tax=Vigna angularis var. angularis TaxID=157739 RepID=A0A0S3S677_PHAAN|nr:hypothetical protein VIGAN_05178800 [Vigna angularis var. angularis]
MKNDTNKYPVPTHNRMRFTFLSASASNFSSRTKPSGTSVPHVASFFSSTGAGSSIAASLRAIFAFIRSLAASAASIPAAPVQ